MKKIIIILICLSIYLCNVELIFADDTIKYKDLIKQQLDIYEMNKEIERNQDALYVINKNILKHEKDVIGIEERLRKSKKEVMSIIYNYYNQNFLINVELLLNVDNIEDFFLVYQLIQEKTKREFKKINKFNEKQILKENLISELKHDKRKKMKLDKKLNENLAMALLMEEKYKNELGLIKDVNKAKKQVKDSIREWETKGIFMFEKFFKEMVLTIQKLPNEINKENIKSKSFFIHMIELEDEELNDFLRNENTLFEEIKFEFDNDFLVVSGDYRGMQLYIKGHYVIKDKNQLSFNIDEIKFNDIMLPKITREEFQDKYDLGFYPNKIMPGVKVKKVSLMNGKMEVEINL